MKIPKEFKLHGKTITVKWDKELRESKDYVGLAEFRKGQILLHPKVSEIYPQSYREQTFLHELTHFILEAMKNDLYEDEKFVDLFSSLLHQALTTMKY